jgi:hypothetical protein
MKVIGNCSGDVGCWTVMAWTGGFGAFQFSKVGTAARSQMFIGCAAELLLLELLLVPKI